MIKIDTQHVEINEIKRLLAAMGWKLKIVTREGSVLEVTITKELQEGE